MVKNSIPKRIFQSIVFSVFLIQGCGRSTISAPTAVLPTKVPIPSVEIHDTLSQKPITPTPDTPAPTPSPTTTTTALPSLTPLPTLDPQAAQKEIARLMETNDQCIGACFWGIVPGVTDFGQAVRFLKTLKDGGLKETNDNYIAVYQYEENILISLDISGLNGKIRNLKVTVVGLQLPDVTGKSWLAFRPDSFVRANRVPKQVNIIMSEGPEGRVGYDMILLYDQMYIRYTGNQITIRPNNTLHACPILDHYIQRFDLWLGPYDDQIKDRGVDFTWLTSLTLEDLSEILVSDPEEACFDLDYQKIYPSN